MRRLAGPMFVLLTFLAACGDEVVVIFSTSFGTIIDDPNCNSGQFDLLDQQGLTLIVVLNDDSTIILANSSPGTCSDLGAGLDVRVRGQQSGSRIVASEVRVQ